MRTPAERFFPRNDYFRARETCLAAEETYGLTAHCAGGSHRAARGDPRGNRKGLPRGKWTPPGCGCAARCAPPRSQSQDPETFLTRLRRGGMLVRLRHDTDGQLVGYAVAQRGDVDAGGEPVWYAGRSLARDLTLPQLAQRWASAPAPGPQLAPEPTEHATVGRAERTAALTNATTAAEARHPGVGHRGRRGWWHRARGGGSADRAGPGHSRARREHASCGSTSRQWPRSTTGPPAPREWANPACGAPRPRRCGPRRGNSPRCGRSR